MKWLCGLCLVAAAGCASLSQSSNISGSSSGQSGNSSAQSGNSSAQSGASSAQSNASSQQSSASSAQSSNSSRSSSGSVQSSADSSNGTTAAPSSSVVAGSALLLAVAGGIITTVYTANHRREARLQQEQLRQLQQQPASQPMPYKVEPIPLQPGVTPPAPTPAPAPGFQPAPFPHSSRLPEGEPSLDAMVMARSWLLANELQLKQDLALGAGPAIEDLAGIAGIAAGHRAHFGRVLQRNRDRLLAPHDVTPQQAAAVMACVGDLVMADPLLRADGDALLAAW